MLYAVAAAALPLTHPLAASVLAAHGAALIALRDRRPDLRRAGIALVVGSTVAAVAARVDGGRPATATPDGAGTLDLDRLGRGLEHAFGWSPVLAIAGRGRARRPLRLPGTRRSPLGRRPRRGADCGARRRDAARCGRACRSTRARSCSARRASPSPSGAVAPLLARTRGLALGRAGAARGRGGGDDRLAADAAGEPRTGGRSPPRWSGCGSRGRRSSSCRTARGRRSPTTRPRCT